MTTLEEVVSDLREEVAALDALLSTLDADAWFLPTPAEGWDIRDTVGHLADTDDLMYEAVSDTPLDGPLAKQRSSFAGESLDDFTAWQVEMARALSPREVYDWWRAATERLHDHLAGCDPKGRYPWRGNMITPLSLASARLMETWAHSLDCFAAAGKDSADTDRLRHIAYLGLRALPHAFSVAGLAPPAPARLDLTSPRRQTWTFGPADAPNTIRGSASDWCRLVGQRGRASARARLHAEGPDAENILEHASAF